MRWSRLLPARYQEDYHKARRRSSMPMLSTMGRVVVFRELFLKREKTRLRQLCIPLKTGRLYLDATEVADWYTYDEVFLEQPYRSSYDRAAVIDVGAHRGMFSAYALAQGAAAVYAYEPDPKNFEYLQRTLKSHQAKGQSSEAHQSAVGSKPGTATFHVYDESWSHSLVCRTDRKLVSTLDVKVVALDDVVERARSKRSGEERLVVKIDAEGAEYDIILNSSPKTLSAIDELFMELHGYATGDPNSLLRRLRDCGFAGLPDNLPSGSHTFVHCQQARRAATAGRSPAGPS